MPSANLMAMQGAVNRISKLAGFPLISTDGGMGPATAQATQKALSWSGIPASLVPGCNAMLTACVSSNGTINQTAIMQFNTDITLVLNMAADALGAPPASPLAVGGGGGGGGGSVPALTPSKLSTFFQPGGGASLVDTVKNLPTWQKVGLGGLGLIATLFIAGKISKAKKAA